MCKFSKPFEMILRKMFSYVDCDCSFDNFDFDQEDWFWKCEWSKEQEEDFKKWLANEIKTNKEVRDLFNTTGRNNKINRSIAEGFVFQWGWKTRRE